MEFTKTAYSLLVGTEVISWESVGSYSAKRLHHTFCGSSYVKRLHQRGCPRATARNDAPFLADVVSNLLAGIRPFGLSRRFLCPGERQVLRFETAHW